MVPVGPIPSVHNLCTLLNANGTARVRLYERYTEEDSL